MTVNTLGTDSRFEDSRPAGESAAATRRSWTDNRWPLLAICIALFSISALVYYHLNRSGLEPTKLLPRLYAGIYDTVGLAPSVIFFLMVAAWGAIWLHNGTLERPLARLGRLLMMAALLGVALNLGGGNVDAPAHKGAFGAWLANRLVDAIGYVPTMVLVWPATFASLMLATEWFFADYFERLRRSARTELGVEAAVTEHLRGLSQVAAGLPREAAAGESLAPVSLRATAPKPGEFVLPAVAIEPAVERPDAVIALHGDAGETVRPDAPGADFESEAESGERLSYAERRAARQARREAVAMSDDSFGESAEPDAAEGSGSAVVGAEELVGGEHAVGEAAAEPPEAGGAVVPGPKGAHEERLPEEGLSDEEVFAIMAAIDDRAESETDSAVVGQRAPEGAPVADDGEAADDVSDHARPSAPGDGMEPASSGASDARLAAEGDGDPVLQQGFIRLDAEVAPSAESASAESASAEFASHAGSRVFHGDREHDLQLTGEATAAEATPADEVVVDEAVVDEMAAAVAADGDTAPPVAIPRPEVVHPSVPTPPSVKQQKLFFGADEGLVEEAIDLVTDSRRATAALLQRKLRVDYELACELLRELAARGVVELEGDASRARVLDS